MECELQPLFDIEETGVHAYLLTINDTLLLVDCGLAAPYETYLRVYDDHIDNISAILLTSAALEHAGACLYILSRKEIKTFIPTNLVPALHATVLNVFFNLCLDMKGHQPVMDFILLDYLKLERLFNSSFIQSPEEINVISVTQSILGSYHRINADEYFWSLQLPPSTNKIVCMPTCRHKSLDILQNRGAYQSLERSVALDLPLSSRYLKGEVCFSTPLNVPRSILNFPLLDSHIMFKLLDRAFTPLTDFGSQSMQSVQRYSKTMFVCDGITGFTNVLALLSTALKSYISKPATEVNDQRDDAEEQRLSYKICLLMDEQVFLYYVSYLRTIGMDSIITPEFYITSRAQQLDVPLPFPLFILTPDPYFLSGPGRQLLFSGGFVSSPSNIIVLTSIRPYLPKVARGSPGYKLLSLILLKSQGKSVAHLTKISTPQLTIMDKDTYQKQLVDSATDQRPQKSHQSDATDGATLSPEAKEKYIMANVSLILGIVVSKYFNPTTKTLDPVIDLDFSLSMLRTILGMSDTHVFIPPADAYKDITLESPPHIRFDMTFISVIVHYLSIGYDQNGYRSKNIRRSPIVKVGGVEIPAPSSMDLRASVLTKHSITVPSNLYFGIESPAVEQEGCMLPYLTFLADANVFAVQATQIPSTGPKAPGSSPDALKDIGTQSIAFQQRLKDLFILLITAFLKDVAIVYNSITDELHLTYRTLTETDEDQGLEGRQNQYGLIFLQNYGSMCQRSQKAILSFKENPEIKASKLNMPVSNALHLKDDTPLPSSISTRSGTSLPFLDIPLSHLTNICMARHRQVQEFTASIKTIIAEKKETATINKLSDANSTEMHCEETMKLEKSEKAYRIVVSTTLFDSVVCACDLIFLLDEPIMQLQDMADILRGRFKKYVVTTSKKLHQAQLSSGHFSDFGNSLLFTAGETIAFSLHDQVPKVKFPVCRNLVFNKIDRKMSIARGYFSVKIDNDISLDMESTHPYDDSAELILLNRYDNSDERRQALRKAFSNSILQVEHSNKLLIKRNVVELNDTGQMSISGNVSMEILDILDCVEESKIYLPF
ncbi:Hypothetical protein GLP15_4139 [Giardia lamblia P15]|uniref:Uncharacterized protein n=1 Tax=Giardia intestinalis (strain P15) TaxID=658858 RepID=E1F0H8_GIAIA|nr:Hypothetical protein GLP15_4139 [Giardia lamblia P15]